VRRTCRKSFKAGRRPKLEELVSQFGTGGPTQRGGACSQQPKPSMRSGALLQQVCVILERQRIGIALGTLFQLLLSANSSCRAYEDFLDPGPRAAVFDAFGLHVFDQLVRRAVGGRRCGSDAWSGICTPKDDAIINKLVRRWRLVLLEDQDIAIGPEFAPGHVGLERRPAGDISAAIHGGLLNSDSGRRVRGRRNRFRVDAPQPRLRAQFAHRQDRPGVLLAASRI